MPMKTKEDFIALVSAAVSAEALKKLVFSRPISTEISKVSARLVAHGGRRLLVFENSLPGNTVSHKNVPESDIEGELAALLFEYKQANLITTLGDAEWKRSKSGAEIILGGNTLLSKLAGKTPDFESAIESLDKKKNYILKGDELFLIKLGISSRDGRIHDKRQGKFRQINRFLEHIEDIYDKLVEKDEITIYDLCCGKSYLSFAVYYYLTAIKGKKVYMLCADLKRDVISWCASVASELGYVGMKFVCEDINKLELKSSPDMVISLHACDVATDIVINTAIRLGAGIVLSTPCCHRYLNGKVSAPELEFVTDYPHIAGKLCEAVTDALRALRLRAAGYSVSALELTDPENTPKNTLIRAIKKPRTSAVASKEAMEKYEAALSFILGDGAKDYLKEIK